MDLITNHFKTIDCKKITDNVFRLIDDEWMLITAGIPENFNTMTASWGLMGILWNKPIAICFIRPQRYTFAFTEHQDYYTLSFFHEEHRSILNFCGTKSGRNTDKIKETGLIPLLTEHGNIGYLQARMVLECRKIYADRIHENGFIDAGIISKNYPTKDFHKFYIGQIVQSYIK